MTNWKRLLICRECGSTDVNVRAWVDANTNEYVDDVDEGEAFCNECEADVMLREETPEECEARTASEAAIAIEAIKHRARA